MSDSSNMTTSEILRCAGVIEKNLTVLEEARQFIEAVPEEDLVPTGQNFSMSLGVSSVEQMMGLFYSFSGSTEQFRAFVEQQMDSLTTYDLLTRRIPFDQSPTSVFFNESADLLIKQTNASLGLLCRAILLGTPGRIPTREPGRVNVEDWDWEDRRIATEALNVARAARTIYQSGQPASFASN